MHELLLKNARILDVRNKRVIRGQVYISDGLIRAVTEKATEKASETVDLDGQYLSPGWMDFHLHIESSMLSPLEFAREAVRHGTTSVFVDPHEIANVLGRRGIDLFLEQSRQVPLDMYVGIPSCVPATNLEDAGAAITLQDIRELLPHPKVFGLAEMMNFPGIVQGIGDAREKVDLAYEYGKMVDGHCPGLRGADLGAYISNGKNDGVARIMSDHETLSAEEAMEKAGQGMYVGLRYGSATRDMERLLPELLKRKFSLDRFMICSDDLDPWELQEHGHLNRTLKKACDIFREFAGLNEEEATLEAISLVSAVPGKYFRRFFEKTIRPPRGEIAVGQKANLVVLGSLKKLDVQSVMVNGRFIIKDGDYFTVGAHPFNYKRFRRGVILGRKFAPHDFIIAVAPGQPEVQARVIEAVPGSLLTRSLTVSMPAASGEIRADPARHIAKLAVIERHRGTGTYALGLVKGLGLTRGAIASTVSHDSHNLIVAGMDDQSMAQACATLAEAGGGMVLIADKPVYLSLPIGGLMSVSSCAELVRKFSELKDAVKKLGSSLESTFMTLSFLALPVIPELRLTNRGLVDVNQFKIVDLILPEGETIPGK